MRKREPHRYDFTFEERNKEARRHYVTLIHYDWRRALTMALTKVAEQQKIPRHRLLMVSMDTL